MCRLCSEQAKQRWAKRAKMRAHLPGVKDASDAAAIRTGILNQILELAERLDIAPTYEADRIRYRIVELRGRADLLNEAFNLG